MLIIGVDCATASERVGLALAEYEDHRLFVKAAKLGSRKYTTATVIADWLRDTDQPTLLALDAPLGWPEPLGRTLAKHNAGEPIEAEANDLFRRETDRFIQRTLGKTPLEVGANLIARTARAALQLLQEIRDQLGLPIPLAWEAPLVETSAIEVYPAATLTARGLRSLGYHRPGQVDARRELLASLADLLDFGTCRALLEDNAHALDAVVCALAGKDFLENQTMPPQDLVLARREGWIWTVSRQHN